MSFDAAAALELLDWKRRVFRLYGRVREEADPRGAWELWRTGRDALFRAHPQSPLPAGGREAFGGCAYFDYDAAARVLARVTPAAPRRVEIAGSAGATFPFSTVGAAEFELAGERRSLALLWNGGYGGGLLVCFRDETSGRETYRAGRYLLDTVKGADLGTVGDLLVLDFNFAYNPSCAYDAAWACPLAPPENHLSVPIRAGERTPPARRPR